MSSTVPPQLTPQGLLAVASFFRLTVDQYHEMIRNNTLTTDDRVELLDGYLVNKVPQNTPHSVIVERLVSDFPRLMPDGWRMRVQIPITLTNSEPEPDGAVVRGDRRTYEGRQPNGSDFGIVIEVADSSLALDRRIKGPVYAAAGIPEYWIVNIADRQIEVYTDPTASPPAYATRTDYAIGAAVPLVLDGSTVATIPVADLIP